MMIMIFFNELVFFFISPHFIISFPISNTTINAALCGSKLAVAGQPKIGL